MLLRQVFRTFKRLRVMYFSLRNCEGEITLQYLEKSPQFFKKLLLSPSSVLILTHSRKKLAKCAKSLYQVYRQNHLREN